MRVPFLSWTASQRQPAEKSSIKKGDRIIGQRQFYTYYQDFTYQSKHNKQKTIDLTVVRCRYKSYKGVYPGRRYPRVIIQYKRQIYPKKSIMAFLILPAGEEKLRHWKLLVELNTYYRISTASVIIITSNFQCPHGFSHPAGRIQKSIMDFLRVKFVFLLDYTSEIPSSG